jgi:serine/threonine protein phosphatase PrpC
MEDVEHANGARWSACSQRGSARDHNSDAFAVREQDGRLVVAVGDGVGALAGSPLASRRAVDAAVAWGASADLSDLNAGASLFAAVSTAVQDALRSARFVEGATTLVCAVVEAGGCWLAAVGDSEIIAVGRAGDATRLNRLDQVPDQPNVITAWVDGDALFEPHVTRLALAPTRLCLVTDGVTKGLDYEALAAVVSGTHVTTAARALVEAAAATGVGDDVTAVVVVADSFVG